MSAEVAIQKFSFPFARAAHLSQENDVTRKGCIQVKTLELRELQDNPVLSNPSSVRVIGAQAHNEKQAQESLPELPPGQDMAAAQVLVCGEASKSTVLSRQCVFEKLIVESEDQRPAAKRQLSSESAARTITVVKKSAVRKEADEPRHLQQKAQLGQRPRACASVTVTRKHRKDLFTSSDVFHRVDSHAVRAGAEVRSTFVCVCGFFLSVCKSICHLVLNLSALASAVSHTRTLSICQDEQNCSSVSFSIWLVQH